MSDPRPASPVVRALMTRAVDYAGLFPPARLDMADAVRAYAEYRASPDAWALGRFVVPASRLEEFEDSAAAFLPTSAAASWALSALLSADIELDAASVDAFNERHRDCRRGAVHVDTVELRAAQPDEVRRAEPYVGGRFDTFVEIPVHDDPAPLVDAIAAIGAKAKIRTGGVTPDAFPGARHVVRFIRACLDRGVSFKATAGLHHPIRAEYRLTYDAGAPRGTMYGFLNVFLAAAFMRRGLDDADALALLDERDPAAFAFTDEEVRWHGHAVSLSDVHAAREEIVSFGSCSFREPVDELQGLGLL